MDYMGAIIWQKTTTMNTSGGGAIMGSFPYPRNGILKIDKEQLYRAIEWSAATALFVCTEAMH